MRLPAIALAALLPLLTSAVAIPDTTSCGNPTITTTKTVYNDKRNPTSTSYAAAATYTVKVGGLEDNAAGGKPILKYDPEFIDGKAGDMIEFQFLANNHTVTQADFATPCVPKAGGFDSGFAPNPENVLGAVTTFYTIKDTNPAWFYCAQPGNGKPHCQAGMVFAINPPKSGGKTLDAFRSAAAGASVGGSPSSPISSSTSAAPVSSTTGYAARATHLVKIGGRTDDGKPILKYDPEYISAKAGDIVKFNFLAANHTATQSSFDTPCDGIPGGFKTGIQSNPGNVDGLVVREFLVVNDKPVWFYCGFSTHCSKQGMVFAINPGNKFDEFKKNALGAPPKPNETTTSTLTSTPTSTGAPGAKQTHYVTVGGLGSDGKPMLRYNPENVVAKVGDIVEFNFRAANHTATQSSFDDPCTGVEGLFKTGVQMNPNDISGLILKQFEVKDDKPAWFYCGVATHCQQGMVFAINPGNKFDEFKEKAKASTPKTTGTATTTATATPTTGAPGARQTHHVQVGGLGSDGKPMLKYTPENVIAKPGDIIEFNFRAANHTATQSSFEDPCNGVDGLFKTGVVMNPSDIDGLLLKQFEVKDDKPAWFYCGVANHCQKGMVFAVNPGNKFDDFKSRAMSSPPKTAVGGSGQTPAPDYSYSQPTGPVTHIVIVGGLGNDGKTPMLRYMPDNVIAKPGDKILFDFKAANHTVTQSSFDKPCEAIDNGFKSGVRMNPGDITGFEMFEIEVKDDKPIWVYCGVANHCQKGMVFAVNPGDKLSAFQQSAKNSTPKSS